MNVHENKAKAAVVLAIGTIVAAASPASAALVIDDFESYETNAVLTANASSTPWLRFGTSVAADMRVTDSSLALSGEHSGRIPLTWSGSNATFRRNYAAAVDLSQYTVATVVVRSSLDVTGTQVQLSFADENGSSANQTAYTTTTAVPIVGGTTQTLTFNLDPAEMTRTTVGSDASSFESALSNVYSIGFRFTSTNGSGGENIYIDDFTVSVPEPTVGMAVVGLGALALRRRRRAI